MQIIKIYPKGFGSNTYILTADNQTAIVIDPSTPRILDELKNRSLTAECVLLTHIHFDHTAGVETLQSQGAKVYCMAQAKPLIATKADCAWAFNAPPAEYTVDETFSDGEEKTLCGIKIKAWHTPGHTEGGACYFVEEEKALFTGDTLFHGTVGRVDLPTGNGEKLRESLRRLATLSGWKVYAGHGEDTDINYEKIHNPFMVDKE